MNGQLEFYVTETGNLETATELVIWNWLRLMSNVLPADHPYRQWYVLGLAWAQVMRQWRDSLPIDLDPLLKATRNAGRKSSIPLLAEIYRLTKSEFSEDRLKSFLTNRYNVTTLGEACVKFTKEMQQQLESVPDSVRTTSRKPGTPGRPIERWPLVQFALERRRLGVSWKAIAEQWRQQNPNDFVTQDAVRSAVRNDEKRRKRGRA